MQVCASCGQENPDGFDFCGRCGSRLAEAEPAREVRKTVTIVFSDVTGSTALAERLDPETTRRVMRRYFHAVRAPIERHGGAVEKFIGDAVMAVFGIPTLHEDDALRAVRAAAEMREALGALNEELERDFGIRIEARTGVNTGEVIAGEGQTLAVGDAVNVAARLEQTAGPGEILLGGSTLGLVAGAVETEAVGPLTLKGKTAPVDAHRLLRVVPGAEPFPRRLDAPMVGREGELAQLRQAYERAVRDRTAYLFTVLGAAGIGKSRLAREFLAGVQQEATVLSGRCLPYGDGITYWPLAEILQRAAHHEARARIVELLSGEDDAELVADSLATLIGDGGGAVVADEIAWATRRLFERLARERPLVVVLDDLQWAEPTFLELVDHLAGWTRDAPVFLFCLARPELLDARPAWGGGKLNSTALLLEPLTDAEARRLLDSLLAAPSFAPALRERILSAAEGNPLFVEQMLAMAGEDAESAVAVPPTIQAVLAARLERLEGDERAALERAAVIGKEFSLADLEAFSTQSVRDPLGALVRKQLIRAERDDRFRFRHLLIRDAAYDAIPKELRAELHERFGARLEESGGGAADVDEIVGYHLEQAHHYRAELGLPDEAAGSLGRRAGARLGSAGRRALDRGDIPAAVNLLGRAGVLVPPSHERAELLLDLARALVVSGDVTRLSTTLEEAAKLADERLSRAVRVRRIELGILTGEEFENLRREAETLVRELEDDEDPGLLGQTRNLLGRIVYWQNDYERGLAESERARLAAEEAGDERTRADAAKLTALVLMWGPERADVALDRCRALLADAHGDRDLESFVLAVSGLLEAMRGDPDLGRETLARGRAMQAELGRRVMFATLSQPAAILELIAGEAAAAERLLREGYAILDEGGERSFLSTVAALLAVAVAEQGRYVEAESLAERSRELGASDDFTTQVHWRAAKAQALAGLGRLDEAVSLAREAIALEGTPLDAALSFDSAAKVMAAVGDMEEAGRLLVRAIAEYERKGCVLGLDRLRERLAGFQRAQSPSSSA